MNWLAIEERAAEIAACQPARYQSMTLTERLAREIVMGGRLMYLGIDPGLASTGLAVIDDDATLLHAECWRSKRDKRRTGDMQARIADLVEWTRARASQMGPFARIAIEWPVAGGRNVGMSRVVNASSQGSTFAAAGALVGALWLPGARVNAPPPMTWRRALGIKGASEALHEMDRLYRIVEQHGKGRAPHIADAIGLALYARLMDERGRRAA